ncbi:MAG: FliH/SctL family protein [Ruminiclostridium sp.]|nr:FliH/SctL family protein [Ruminiclostridium sp.]
MYNAYGSNVYKKYQVNMCNPYQMKPKKATQPNKGVISPVNNAKDEADDILENAQLEAEKILKKANEEANAILEAAQEEIAAFMQNAMQQAKEEGYKNGEELARKHYQILLEEAEAFKQQAKEALEDTVSSMEEEMVDTVLEISKKIMGIELSQNRDVIIGLIRTALLGSSLSGEAVVHVCPDDYDYVEENKDKLLLAGKNNRNIEIYKDCGMEKGECLIETEYGSVESSIEAQYSGIERSFKELLGNDNGIS